VANLPSAVPGEAAGFEFQIHPHMLSVLDQQRAAFIGTRPAALQWCVGH
jgi:hypothetical protein